MRVLSIETSSRVASISLLDDNGILAGVSWTGDDVAGELVARLRSILPAGGEDPGIGLVVVSLGPGSWTGIRTGISFGAGLAAGWGAEIAGVHLPESVFLGLEHVSRPVCCVANAFRGKVYCSFRRKRPRASPAIETKDPRELVRSLEEPTIFAGPALDELDPPLLAGRRVRAAAPWFRYPRASLNAAVVLRKKEKNIPLPPVEPFYGR